QDAGQPSVSGHLITPLLGTEDPAHLTTLLQIAPPSTAPKQDRLALQTQPGDSHPSVQESEAQEEIAPGDIKYRLEPLPKAPLQTQPPRYSNQHSKPQRLSFSTTYGECYKPGRIQPVTYHGENPPIQISLQSPLLGQSTFPVHIQGRKIGPIVRPGQMEYSSQYQSDFQASGWNQVLKTDPDKRSQGINKYTQTVQKDNASGWQPTMHQHPKPRWVKQEMTILGRKSTVKFDRGTVTRVKCPSSLSRGNQHEGPNYSLNPRRGMGVDREQRKTFTRPGHPNPTCLEKSRNFTFLNLQPLMDSDICS
uniref:Uncharacterized protein n=1 Tax=Felis catus TaxID=9685 RepID=A0ABI7YAN2_FELCA